MSREPKVWPFYDLVNSDLSIRRRQLSGHLVAWRA
jgi:hypothetical protein